MRQVTGCRKAGIPLTPQATAARAALFDLDGTLLRPPSAETRFLFYAIRSGRPWLRNAVAWIRHLPEGRPRDNKACYRGLPLEEAEQMAEACFAVDLRDALVPEVCAWLREHKRQGETTGLLTGAPQFIAAPIGRHLGVDFVAGTRLQLRDGAFTGHLDESRPYGVVKAARARQLASELGVDLADCAAYGNELADRFLLEAVSYPVAVNPGARLDALARKRGWRVERTR